MKLKISSYYLLTCLFITASWPVPSQTRLKKGDPRLSETAEIYRFPQNNPDINERQHELVPSIAASTDGDTLYIAWYSGGSGEGPGNFVTVAVSDDGGKTWHKDALVVCPKDSAVRFFDPVLWRDGKGTILLNYAVCMYGRHWDCRGGVNEMCIKWTGTEMEYTEPVVVSYGVMMNKPLEIPEKRSVLYPVSVWNLGKDFTADSLYIGDGTYIGLSRNRHGRHETSRLRPYSKIEPLPRASRTFDEHNLVQIEGPHLMAIVRGRYGMYVSHSYDYGKTWKSLKPFVSAGPTTSSRVSLTRLESGNILLVMNASTKRNNMTAFLSYDGGMTWSRSVLLDGREQVSYPDVSQSSDGMIHVTFDRDRKGAKEIWYLRLTENDIRNGKAENIYRINLNAHEEQ